MNKGPLLIVASTAANFLLFCAANMIGPDQLWNMHGLLAWAGLACIVAACVGLGLWAASAAMLVGVLALAMLTPAKAQTARDVDLAIAAISAQERWIAARSAHRRFVELYDYRPTVVTHRPQRSGGCRYTPQQRACWSHIRYR